MLRGVIEQLVDRPALMANSTTFLFNTGSAPGMPRQTGQVWELGSEPNAVEQPQKILESVLSCTWTSRPMTGWNFMEISPDNYSGAFLRCQSVACSKAWAARRMPSSSKGLP